MTPSTGAAPAVVVLRAEERLVDGAADKRINVTVVCADAEHVVEGVGLRFEPELVVRLDAVRNTVDGGFACAVDERLVIGGLDGTSRALDFASEENVPRSVTAVHGVGVWGDVGCVKFTAAVCFEACKAKLPEPAVNFIGQGVVRVVGREVNAPSVQNVLERNVERGHAE